MRVLGAIRQSKTRERAVSPAAQRAAITRWAEANGHQVVKFTEDLSQSGKLSAFKRPELGPWLTDPDKVVAWDILVTTKIDRACRNAKDFLNLQAWCEEHRKQYVSLRENIDMTTASGRKSARDSASAAEWERDMASERRLETLAELAEQGRWTGGKVPYGMRADETAEGFYLVPDDGGTAEVARQMADMAIAGTNNVAIRRWVNDNGYPNSAGNSWSTNRVRQVLHSASMLDILGEAKHAELRAALRSRTPTRGEWTSGQHWLLRVAYCAQDHKPLYAALRRNRDYKGYYRCLECGMVARITVLEDGIEAKLREMWDDQPYKVRKLIPGDDYAKELRKLRQQLESVQGMDYIDTSELEARIAELRAAPHEPDEIVLVDTGATVAEHWDALGSPAERNRFLRDRDVRFLVTSDGFESCSIPAEWIPRHVSRRQ
jgi:DNA invertase Pin-like site-specific DNA recombinase